MEAQNKTYKFIADCDNRIDSLTASHVDDLSRSSVQNLIISGNVKVNGILIYDKKHKVKQGDEIEVIVPPARSIELLPEDIPLDIVYQDSDIVIINKQKNLSVHPSDNEPSGTLVNGLLNLPSLKLSGINGEFRPGIVHRIDKDTTGLIVVAKNDIAHRFLSEQFREHSIKREYFAVCFGSFTCDEATIENYIGRHPVHRKKFAIITSESRGKFASTHYEVLSKTNIDSADYSLVKVTLKTGRTHQIRVHLSNISHPIVGDKLYSNKTQPFNLETQLLHAKTLGFVHPTKKTFVEFDSKLPEDFKLFFNE